MSCSMLTLLVVLTGCCLTSILGSTTKDFTKLKIKIGVVKNEGDPVTTNLLYANSGNVPLESASAVQIHVCFIRPLYGLTFNTTYTEIAPGVTFRWVQGCYHRIEFTPPFLLKPSESRSLTIKLRFSIVAYTDFIPNWYIQVGNEEPQLLESTDTEDLQSFVEPFDTKDKLLKSTWDASTPWTPEQRDEQFNYTDIDPGPYDFHTVPTTLMMEINDTDLTTPIDQSWTLEGDVTGEYSGFLIEQFNVNRGKCTGGKCVQLNITTRSASQPESYKLQIDPATDIVKITGSDEGIQRSFATILQLTERFNKSLPKGVIEDRPRMNYRGFLLDIARNLRSVETVKNILKVMHRYKLNVLHLHLSDDEAWRLQIEGLEELTEVGARTCFNQSMCILPQLGHKVGPPQYWTKSDYMTVLKFANSLGIEVVPEIDIPAHSHAAIHAMNARYQKNSTVDYRLADPKDTSEYFSPQFFNDNVINGCLNSTWLFLEKVVSTIVSYHREAGVPINIFHFGGDEIGDSSSQPYVKSPACYQYWNGTPEIPKIRKYVLQRLGALVARFPNISLGLWEDGLMETHGKEIPFNKTDVFPESLTVVSYFWQNVWEWNMGSRGYNLANAGYKVILQPASDFYFDHPYEPSPFERGYYWATRYTSNKKVFTFKPDNLYDNIEGAPDTSGNILTRFKICQEKDKFCPALTPAGRANIMGMQAALWSDLVRTDEQLYSNVFPRLVAFAERAWHKSEWEDKANATAALQEYASFTNSLGEKELVILLSKYNVTYHVSAPGAHIHSMDGMKMIHAVTEFPQQTIWYKTDKISNWTDMKSMIDFTGPTQIYASDPTKILHSFSVLVDEPAAVGNPTKSSGVACTQLQQNTSYFLLLVSITMICW